MTDGLRDYWSDPDEEEAKPVTFVMKSPAEDRIRKRIEEYMADLDKNSITVSDRSQIKNLARLEISIEELTEKLANIGTVDSRERKSLTDSLTTLMAQHSRISSLLGIDRKSRASRGDSEFEEYLPRVHREAKAFLDEHAVVIVCPNCMGERARVRINEGVIIFHYRDDVQWAWSSTCPRCQQMFTINRNNWKNFTPAAIEKAANDYATSSEEDQSD